MGLTNKQKTFIDAYLGSATFNATEAARLAGYGGDSNALAAAGSRLLKNVKVAGYIAKYLSASAMTREEVLKRLGDIARVDISEFITATGAIDWGKVREKGSLVKKISHHTGRQSQIELHDAQSALALLAKHHRLLGDFNKTLNIDLSSLTTEQLKRLAAGEDIIDVLVATSGESGTRTPESPSDGTDRRSRSNDVPK